jgi:hypothetical protein
MMTLDGRVHTELTLALNSASFPVVITCIVTSYIFSPDDHKMEGWFFGLSMAVRARLDRYVSQILGANSRPQPNAHLSPQNFLCVFYPEVHPIPDNPRYPESYNITTYQSTIQGLMGMELGYLVDPQYVPRDFFLSETQSLFLLRLRAWHLCACWSGIRPLGFCH